MSIEKNLEYQKKIVNLQIIHQNFQSMKISIKEILMAIAIIAILAVAQYFLPYRIACAFDAGSEGIHIFGLPFILVGLILLSIVVFFVLKAMERPCPHLIKKSLVVLPTALVAIIPVTYYCAHNYSVGYHGSNYGVLYNRPYEGVANQWGKVIIEPNFEFINIAYDNSSNKTVFICCNVNKTENGSWEAAYGCKMFFTIFSESGQVIDNREGYFASSGSTVREFLGERYSNIKPLGYGGSLDYTDGEDHYLHIDFLDANIGHTKICDTNDSSSTSDNSSSSNSSSSNNNNSSDSEQPQPRQPERHETLVPVQVWKQCVNCWGSGQCQYCYGQGYIVTIYGDQDCPVCTDGRCSICAGQGGHYETEYETRVDYY